MVRGTVEPLRRVLRIVDILDSFTICKKKLEMLFGKRVVL